jgi:hypothetical protein
MILGDLFWSIGIKGAIRRHCPELFTLSPEERGQAIVEVLDNGDREKHKRTNHTLYQDGARVHLEVRRVEKWVNTYSMPTHSFAPKVGGYYYEVFLGRGWGYDHLGGGYSHVRECKCETMAELFELFDAKDPR